MVRTKVDVRAFKLTRKASLLKHTGVILKIEALKTGSEHELLGSWIHEVTGGTDQENPTGNKSVLIRRRRPTHEDEFETQQVITNFELDLADHLALGRFESLFDYDHTYNFVTNNCRNHVLNFIDRLKGQGYRINEKAVDFVKNIQNKDAVIGTGAFIVGAAAVGAALWYASSWLGGSDETYESNESDLPLAPSGSSSSVFDRKDPVQSYEEEETSSVRTYTVKLTAQSDRVIRAISPSGHPLPSTSEVIQAIIKHIPQVSDINLVDKQIIQPSFATFFNEALDLTLKQPYAHIIAQRASILTFKMNHATFY